MQVYSALNSYNPLFPINLIKYKPKFKNSYIEKKVNKFLPIKIIFKKC